MRKKKPCYKAVRTTISMPPELFRIASKKQRINRYSSFSNYIQSLIRSTAQDAR
jgi:hypothetical protein